MFEIYVQWLVCLSIRLFPRLYTPMIALHRKTPMFIHTYQQHLVVHILCCNRRGAEEKEKKFNVRNKNATRSYCFLLYICLLRLFCTRLFSKTNNIFVLVIEICGYIWIKFVVLSCDIDTECSLWANKRWKCPVQCF